MDLTLTDRAIVPTYDQIRTLEAEIAKLPPADIRVEHYFAHGVYGRALFISAGTALTGKIHRESTLNILLKGCIRVTGEDGAVREMEAPAVFVSPPNCKKVGFAITDTIWINVHPTKLTDLAAIEAKFIVPEAPLLEHGGSD
jgi:hypothetical protein